MEVITISGKAESGKDTTARILKEELESMGYSVVITHYADLLKYICKKFFDWNCKKDEEGRTLLQMVGTNTIRQQQPDYWVDFVKQILRFFPNEWDYVLIPDARFLNEIESVKEEFKVISVKVERPDYENHLTEEQRNHPSETALDKYKFDYTLINDGTYDGLSLTTKDFIRNMTQGGIG